MVKSAVIEWLKNKPATVPFELHNGQDFRKFYEARARHYHEMLFGKGKWEGSRQQKEFWGATNRLR